MPQLLHSFWMYHYMIQTWHDLECIIWYLTGSCVMMFSEKKTVKEQRQVHCFPPTHCYGYFTIPTHLPHSSSCSPCNHVGSPQIWHHSTIWKGCRSYGNVLELIHTFPTGSMQAVIWSRYFHRRWLWYIVKMTLDHHSQKADVQN